MSRENVEIVRRASEAYARGDLVAVLRDVDAELIVHRDAPDGATFHGPDGLVKAIADWVEGFNDIAFATDELIDANGNQVMARIRTTGTGARSGARIEAEFWFVYTLRDAKLIRLDMFTTKQSALEAAGLRE